jgi:taurine transport system substrate-binding protein
VFLSENWFIGEDIDMKTSFKVSIVIIIVLLSLFAISSCGSNSSGTTPDKIRIGYLRVPNDETIAKSEGLFAKYLADKNIETEFIIFDSGVDANKALLAGSIDFASMGHTNGVIALATGIDAELIWIHEVLGEAEQLVVRDDAGINSIEDLSGRKVATVFASTAHFSLLHALRDAGIENSVTLLDMQTADIVAAWQRGDIDAAYTWQPTLDQLLTEGTSLVTSEEMANKGVVTANILLARRGFSENHPELTSSFISALMEAGKLYKNDPEKAADLTAAELEISPDITAVQMLGSRWLTPEEMISADFLGTSEQRGHFAQVIKDTAVFLAEQNSIDTIPSDQDIEKFVNPSYIEKSLSSNQD